MSCLYVTTQGTKLRRIAGQYVVTRKDEQLSAMPKCMVEAVLLFGHVQITSQAVHSLLEEGVPLLYLTRGGGFKGMLQPGFPKNTEVRLAQYEAATDPAFAPGVARSIIECKLHNSCEVVMKWKRNKWYPDPGEVLNSLKEYSSVLSASDNVGQMRSLEGRAAQRYFDALGRSLPPEFSWRGRNRQPPRDPVNAMLSLSYMLLLGRAISACYAAGLDPQVGFLHQLEYGRPSLALDLLEPLRSVCCDQFVLRSLQAEEFTPSDFTLHPERGCRLRPDALHRFLSRFQAWTDPHNPNLPPAPLMPLARRLRESIRTRDSLDWISLWRNGT